MEGRTAKAVRTALEPAVRDLGYDLIWVEITAAYGRRIVRLYIDREGDEAVGISDCVSVAREVSPVLDVEDPVDEAFNLEVSSPGLDRPLGRRQDLERFAGSRVKVRTHEAVSGRRSFTGTLGPLNGDEVVVHGEDGTDWSVPLEAIKRANVLYTFE